MKKNTQSSVLKWALILSIIIVLNLFFNYALSFFYEAPDSNRFFGATTENECEEVGGNWMEHSPQPVEREIKGPNGYCDASEAYNAVREPYEQNVFLVLVVLGVLSLVIGVLAPLTPVVSAGLSYGGVLSLVIGSMRYWSSADEGVRLLILTAALAALIWLGISKFKE